MNNSSTINVADSKNYAVTEYRTSKTCHFNTKDPFINDIQSRICKTVGINNRNTELIQGQKYEIGQQFRNESIDCTHNPEFTSLELYQSFADYNDMIELCETLLSEII